MSTRAHIIIKDENSKYYVYHHHDGYPDGVGEDLREFLSDEGKNISNAYEFAKKLENWDGSYEFENVGLHGDEEYVYVIDLSKRTYVCYDVKKHENGIDWWDIPEEEVYHCKKEIDEIF